MRERLRVCWLVPGFPSGPDDPFYPFLGREAVELCQSGEVELTVITEHLRAPATFDGFEVVPITAPQAYGKKVGVAIEAWRSGLSQVVRLLADPARHYPLAWRSAAILAELRRCRPHVVHSHFAVPNGTAGVGLARSVGATSAVSLRGVDVQKDQGLGYGFCLDPTFEAELVEALGAVDRCFAATSSMADRALEAGAHPDRLEVLPNSFRLPAHRAARSGGHATGRSDGAAQLRSAGVRRLALSVGNLIELKGFDRGIRALTRLPDDWHYAIVGEGPRVADLERQARHLGVAHRVHFVGSVSPRQVATWMADADCIWFLSRIEAFGNVILEGLGSGSPVVAVRTGIAPEVLAGLDDCALLDDPDDPDELAQRAVHASAFASRNGGGISVLRRDRLTRFDPERRTQRLLAAYRSMLFDSAADSPETRPANRSPQPAEVPTHD